MSEAVLKGKRVVLICWKKQNQVEVFSNLKNFCLSYPQYNYNTLNNYLSKDKIAFENDLVRVERKEIIAKPKSNLMSSAGTRNIAPVVRKVSMKKADDSVRDLRYWLSQPVNKRAEAVTFLVSQMLKKGQRMDKTAINKIRPEQ